MNLALGVLTRDADKVSWAYTELDLEYALRSRVRGDRADNIEEALEAVGSALTVFTQNEFPLDWASAQSHLALVLEERLRGDRAENQERAIDAYQKCLIIYTKENNPGNWAIVQNNLGLAYKNRIRGDHSENIEIAIVAFQNALAIRNQHNLPREWASTTNSLGLSYLNRVRGDRRANIETAIDYFQKTLDVYRQAGMLVSWAIGQHNLGDAFSARVAGQHADNIELAINAYKAALTVCTREGLPLGFISTEKGLAQAYESRPNGSARDNQLAAADADVAAMATVDDLIGDGFNQRQIEDLMNQAGDLYRAAAMRAVSRGDVLNAISIAERGRARLLNAQLRIDVDARALSPSQASQLTALREELQNIEAQLTNASNLLGSTTAETIVTAKQGVPVGPNSTLTTKAGVEVDLSATLSEATDPVTYSERQGLLRSRASDLRARIKSLLPPTDSRTAPIATPSKNEAILMPLVDKNSAALLLITAEGVVTVPLPSISSTALSEIYQSSQGNSDWRTGYSALTTKPSFKTLPLALVEAEATLGTKLFAMLAEPLEKALSSAGIPTGSHLVFLSQGLLARLPFWLAKNPETGETLAERYVITTTPSLEVLRSLPSKLEQGAPVVAWFNDSAGPPLALTPAAHALFKLAVRNARFISAQEAGTPQSTIEALKGGTRLAILDARRFQSNRCRSLRASVGWKR